MSLLRKLTGKQEEAPASPESEAVVQEEPVSTSCPHTALVPRWDSVEDMGKEDKATSYFCQGCERTFTPEEAQPYLG
jgi:hypothetical protein